MSRYYHVTYGYRRRSKLRRFFVVVAVVFIVVLGGTFGNQRTQEEGVEVSQSAAVSAEEKPKVPPRLPWPTYGSSAYAETEKGIVAASDETDKPIPIASLAKVITALAILEKKPLIPGEQGPMLTLNEQDVALYDEYLRKNGSVVPVEVGEQISQHQAMQAMLMSSANNISDSLVRWAFGSVEEYTAYANEMVKKLGLTNTLVADATGFSPSTVSTPAEMTQLGILYMENPVLRDIAMRSEADIPVAGKIKNYNAPVNENDIVGIKVGHTDEAGRCFLVANIEDSENSAEKISVAVVLGASDLRTAMADARKILEAGKMQDQQ